MVWFSEDVLSLEMIFENFLLRLRHVPVEEGEEESTAHKGPRGANDGKDDEVSPSLHVSTSPLSWGRNRRTSFVCIIFTDTT